MTLTLDRDQYLAMVLREASNVQRMHTLPHHGEYTVGKHVYDMLSLLFVFHPNPSVKLIKAIMFHNLPERWTGDIPYPAKKAGNEFTIQLLDLETRIKNHVDLFTEDEMLSHEEYCWLVTLDKLETLLWAKDQVGLGNANAASVAGETLSFLNHWKLPENVLKFIKTHQWMRISDQLPGKSK